VRRAKRRRDIGHDDTAQHYQSQNHLQKVSVELKLPQEHSFPFYEDLFQGATNCLLCAIVFYTNSKFSGELHGRYDARQCN
jgi:hypothetical protein